MKKILVFVPLLIGLISLGSCSPPKIVKEEGSLMDDMNFYNGFNVKGSKYSKKYDKSKNVYFNPNGAKSSSWAISCWNRADAYDLTTINTFTKLSETKFEYKNDARTLMCDNKSGALTFKLDTSLEYIADYGKPHLDKPGEWSHFLIDKSLRNCYISNYDDCFVDFDFTLHECDYKGLPDADRSGADGASQIFMYIRVAGGEPVSRYMWCGIPVFDSRYNVIAPYIFADSGHVGSTNDLIYSLSNSKYMPVNKYKGVEKEKTYHIRVNIKELVMEAYNYAQRIEETSKCSWKNIPYETINLLYFNYGYEMPGAFYMSSTLDNLSFTYRNYVK